MYSFYSVTTMTTISKGNRDVRIYWLTQTKKRDVYAMMQKYYFVFYLYIFTWSQYQGAKKVPLNVERTGIKECQPRVGCLEVCANISSEENAL